jgi:hypothetical protein
MLKEFFSFGWSQDSAFVIPGFRANGRRAPHFNLQVPHIRVKKWPGEFGARSPRHNPCQEAAHLLTVKMLQRLGRMARHMHPRFCSTVAFSGLLALLMATSVHAQLEGDTPPPKGLSEAQPAAKAQSPASASTPLGMKRVSKDFSLKGESSWTDTGIEVQPGDHILVSAQGTMRYADAKEDNGPDGLTRGFKDLLRILPLNAAGRGSLIGRVGDADVAQPFLIGTSRDSVTPVAGRLSLGINQAKNETGDGSYRVHVDVYAADSASGRNITVAKSVTALPGIDNSLFAKIPRRVADKEGKPGDMVNFLILGSEAAMQRVFTAAGWVKVDADVKGTLLHGLIVSLSKESYLTMPMSQLYLFGRPQDYGWAHAEPISVVASRNHLRIWKAPFTVNGEMLWVGAATHDIGFERDERNNGVTHKIDPDIDLERDYVQKTLISTGLVAEVSHFLPENPMKEARTATGGSFHSSGQVLILRLAESAKDLTLIFIEAVQLATAIHFDCGNASVTSRSVALDRLPPVTSNTML